MTGKYDVNISTGPLTAKTVKTVNDAINARWRKAADDWESHVLDLMSVFTRYGVNAYCLYNANRLYKKTGFGDDQGKQG